MTWAEGALDRSLRDRLVCTECGAVTEDGGLGWRGYLVGVDDELDDEETVAVYCPECAKREFDGAP